MIDYTKRPKRAVATVPEPEPSVPTPRVAPRALPAQLTRDQLQPRLFAWLTAAFENVYANPANAVIVPFGTTRVVIDSDEFFDGRCAVQLRSAILQDIPPSAQLVDHVAHHADQFKIGTLYLYPEGDRYDLDFSIKVMHCWLDADSTVELVEIAAQSALDQAEQLHHLMGGTIPNPGGQNHQRLFIGPESRGRQDVWDVLERSLDTQRCDLLGTAERISLNQSNVLVDGWFVLADHWLWAAGRREHDRETIVWRVPRADITMTKRLDLFGLPTFVAYFGRDQKLCLGTTTDEAVDTLEGRCR